MTPLCGWEKIAVLIDVENTPDTDLENYTEVIFAFAVLLSKQLKTAFTQDVCHIPIQSLVLHNKKGPEEHRSLDPKDDFLSG